MTSKQFWNSMKVIGATLAGVFVMIFGFIIFSPMRKEVDIFILGIYGLIGWGLLMIWLLVSYFKNVEK